MECSSCLQQVISLIFIVTLYNFAFHSVKGYDRIFNIVQQCYCARPDHNVSYLISKHWRHQPRLASVVQYTPVWSYYQKKSFASYKSLPSLARETWAYTGVLVIFSQAFVRTIKETLSLPQKGLSIIYRIYISIRFFNLHNLFKLRKKIIN